MKRGVLQCMICGVALIVGCESPTPPVKGRGENPSEAPTANLSVPEAIVLAEGMRLQNPELMTSLGGGKSMEPYYTENTVILVSPIDYDALAPGMNVAYVNRLGKLVVHQTVRKERTGWVVRGTNNVIVDQEKVTRENLKGIVHGVFYTGD